MLILLFTFLLVNTVAAQETTLNPDSVLYKKSWQAGMRLKSDGFSFNAEIARSKRFKREYIFQVGFSYYFSPKQVKQQSPLGSGGLFGSDGFKSFIYGKQNNQLNLYAGVGQKFLLAEKARKHGVQIFFKYAGGITLAILKPYLLKVAQLDSSAPNTIIGFEDVQYDANNLDNGFLFSFPYVTNDLKFIAGASGFGKGWKLKALPGLHIETGIDFDFGKNDSFIKTLEVGAMCDFYYKKVPIMVEINADGSSIKNSNKFIYPSVYVGLSLGKRKVN